MSLDLQYFPLEESFSSLNDQSFNCPSLGGFSATSSLYEPLTPTASRRSTPANIKIEYDENNMPIGPWDLSPTRLSPGHYVLDNDRSKGDCVSFPQSLPTTPVRGTHNMRSAFEVPFELSNINTLSANLMGSMTPANTLFYQPSPESARSQSFAMTPSRSFQGHDAMAAASPWNSSLAAPIDFSFSQPNMMHQDAASFYNPNVNVLNPSFHAMESMSPNKECLRTRRMKRQAQKGATKRDCRSSKMMPDGQISVGTEKKAENVCNFPGCVKKFVRKEHLKRHKDTERHHEDQILDTSGPTRFACEWCDHTTNRLDNLKTHRKLHGEKKQNTRSVKFIPEAVPILRAEALREKKRQSSRAPPSSHEELAAHALRCQ